MFTVVCRTPRALVFEPGNELGVYPRVLFEMRTAMCGMLHGMPVAGVAGAWRVFAARWGPVLLSHVSSQCAPVGVVCDSEAVHVICVCIELAPETLCVRLGCGLYCLQTKTCRRRNVNASAGPDLKYRTSSQVKSFRAVSIETARNRTKSSQVQVKSFWAVSIETARNRTKSSQVQVKSFWAVSIETLKIGGGVAVLTFSFLGASKPLKIGGGFEAPKNRR